MLPLQYLCELREKYISLCYDLSYHCSKSLEYLFISKISNINWLLDAVIHV